MGDTRRAGEVSTTKKRENADDYLVGEGFSGGQGWRSVIDRFLAYIPEVYERLVESRMAGYVSLQALNPYLSSVIPQIRAVVGNPARSRASQWFHQTLQYTTHIYQSLAEQGTVARRELGSSDRMGIPL